MASLFEIGKTGVQAYRQALSVTGQNIANINTDGYNKRRADVAEVAGVTGGPTNVSDQSGLGVRVTNVRRSFDAYLADKTRTSQSDYEMLNDFVSKLSDLENMLLPSGSDLGVFIGRFFDTLQDVASNPDSISARAVSLEAGRALSSAFNNYDEQFKNFKSNSLRQVDIKITEANLYINQLVEVNKLIATSGSSDASNDVLDARDKLLIDLSKLLNFTVDYADTGEAIVRLGDSGKGAFLINRSKGSVITSASDDKNISLIVNEGGGKKTAGIYSSGIISGISNFYNLVDSVSSEISKLAEQFANDVNEIQTSGIDLNGKSGKAMFSVNSMLPQANFTNKSELKLNIIEGDPSKIIQEKILVNYSKINNNWEIRDSKGLSTATGNKINFNGYQIEIIGQPQDGDGFQISPSLTKAGAMKFHLLNPEDFAAASKSLISKSASNVGGVELNIIGATTQSEIDHPPSLDKIFSSSTNPLVATSFLKDGPVTTIPSSTRSINLSSIGNQSSATFTISDADIKGFSSFSIKLTDGSNNEEITISSAATDPGDGIKTVQEFANLLNSGLMLDGKSQHDFRKLGLFATGSNGFLSIASSSKDISSSSILSRGNSFSPSISNLTAGEAAASNLQIFTRDGRHVSGTSLNASQIASLIKTENGFLESAEYRNDYINNNYRGIDSNRKTAKGDFTSSFGSNLSYNEQETDMDGLLTSKTVTNGTLTLDGTKIYSKELNSIISIACEKDESSRTFTVTGYDLDGLYQTETIPGGNATTVVGSKVFSRVRDISINGNSAGKVTIGTEAIGYSLKVTNNDNIEKTTNVPVGSSAYYLANKLNTELAGTGVHVSASTKVLLGPFNEGVSGSITFDLKGKNPEAVSINASIDASDISALAKRINEYSSQTGLSATVTGDFKKIIIESKDGYDINLKNITAPSDFTLEVFGKDFEKLSENDSQLNSKLLIDISDTKKASANIKGELKFISSETFTTQINSGVSNVAVTDSLTNGYINIDRSKTGEVVTIKPEIFNDLDNSLGSPDGKKAVVGLSKYGIDINQKDYKLFVNDDDSLFKDAALGTAGTITLDGKLKDANDLNAVITIFCAGNEGDNTFTVTGTNSSGTTITEQIKGATKTDDDSLFTLANPGAAGTITLNGALKEREKLNAVVTIFCTADESLNTFTVTGTNSSGTTITEQIKGTTASNTAEGLSKFSKITSITTSAAASGTFKIGTKADTVVGSTKFTTITSITTSANGNGNIKIGTASHNDINDDDSLVQLTSFISGNPIELNGVLSTSEYLGAKIQIKSREDTTGTTFIIAGIDLNNNVIEERILGSNGGVVTTNNIFKSVTSITSSGTNNGKIKIGTKAADGNWNTTIDANALNIDTQKEISTALLTSLRSETPTAQLKSKVINALPIDGQSVDLSFEGQVYTLKMASGELLVEGPETNRIKARINGTSENISNFIATAQTGTAATPLIINGLNSTAADSDGLVTDTNPTVAGVIPLTGALKDSTSLNSRITIKNTNNDDNTAFKFTITGTDIDGNVITDEITGVNGDNATNTGTKVFKTVTEIRIDGDHGDVEIGTTPAFASSLGTRVSITATSNESENSFTIVGTGTDGLSKTETISGPNSGKTVVSLGLFKTIHSITPASNTSGNVEIGTAPGFELIATAEGTIEGAQFKLVANTANTANAETFGLKEGTTTMLGNFVVQPTSSSPAIGIEVTQNNIKTDYAIKFENDVPVFFNSDGSAFSGSPSSLLTLSWNESSGTTDDDSLFNNNMSAGVGIITDGILSTTDVDGLLTSKSATAGILSFDGALKNSKALNGKITIKCAGNEVGNSFVISGLDTEGVFKTETISGVNNSTAIGTISFSEITAISVANNTASTIEVGVQATSVVMEPQVITITPAGDDTGEKYTITGLDQFGNSQTEVLTAKGSDVTVTGEKVFTQVSSIVPASASASSVKIGTKKVGRLSLSYTVDKLDFKIDTNPNANKVYGLKTQDVRAVIDNDVIKVTSFSGEPVKVDIPDGSIQNSVAEKISLTNLPPEDLITIVMGGGARKISAEYDQFSESENLNNQLDPELTIKVDATNKNKVEIFDKISGHSIASRILDVNRVFEVNNTKFQFSEDTIVNNSFDFSSNKDGFGDNRNIINILNLQGSDKSGSNKGNFQEIFNTTVAKVGSNVQASKLSLDSASSTLDAAEASQSEFAGVNLDEEAAHLLEFQQAYQASARILQTAREMFQSLIDVV